VGLSGWLDGLSRHVASQQCIEGFPSWLSAALAAALPVIWLNNGQATWRRLACCAAIGTAALILAAAGTSFVLTAVAAPIGLAASFASLRTSPDDVQSLRRRVVGLALVTAWYCGLAVATPCYWPYPRLLLPWLLAAWIGAALLLEELARAILLPAQPKQSAWRLPALTAAMVGLAALAALYHHPRFAGQRIGGESRLNLLAACREIITDLGPSTQPRVIYVLGEPAVLFQLKAAGEPLVVPVQEIPDEPAREGGRPIATYLVLGPHWLGDAPHEPDRAVLPRSRLVASHEYRPSLLVALDLYDPRRPAASDQRERNQLTLYRLASDR
jgi:hypothetical protein